jgi:hypothetical protein
MPSIEVEIRRLRGSVLVIERLADSAALAALHDGAWDHVEREAGFWWGLESMMKDVASFLERLTFLAPATVLNLEMPPAGSPVYDADDQPDAQPSRSTKKPKKKGGNR